MTEGAVEWRKLMQFCDSKGSTISAIQLTSGIATLAAKAAPWMSFKSIIVGIDCRSLQLSSCYCMDEYVDGASFNSDRSLVAVWNCKFLPDLEFYDAAFSIFNTSEPACSSPLHTFTLTMIQRPVIRSEWHGKMLIILTGEHMRVECVYGFSLHSPLTSAALFQNYVGSPVTLLNHFFIVSDDGRWRIYGAQGMKPTLFCVSGQSRLLEIGAYCFSKGSSYFCLRVSTAVGVNKLQLFSGNFALDQAGQTKEQEVIMVLDLTASAKMLGLNLTNSLQPWLGVMPAEDGMRPNMVWFSVGDTFCYAGADGSCLKNKIENSFLFSDYSSRGNFAITASNTVWGFAPQHEQLGSPGASQDLAALRSIHSTDCQGSKLNFKLHAAFREAFSFNQKSIMQNISLVVAGRSVGVHKSQIETQKLLFFLTDRRRHIDPGKCKGNVKVQCLDGRPDLQACVPPKTELVMTEPIKAAVERIIQAEIHGQSVLLEGEAASGKTAVVLKCAQECNAPLTRFNVTPHTTISDLLGQLELDNESFTFKLGVFAVAVKDGHWLLLDEANLAPDGVLRAVEDVLGTGFLMLTGSTVAGMPAAVEGRVVIPRHPNFRLFIAQNPSGDARYSQTRNTFGVSLLSHFVPVVFPGLGGTEMKDIISSKLRCSKFPRPDDCSDALIDIFVLVNQEACLEHSKHSATLRDTLQAADLITTALEDHRLNVLEGLKQIFLQKLKDTEGRKKVTDLIEKKRDVFFGDPGRQQDLDLDGETFRDLELAFLPEYRGIYDMLDIGRATGKPVLVCGEHLSGKAAAVRKWVHFRYPKKSLPDGRTVTLLERALTPDVTTEDLFGRVMPTSRSDNTGPPFEWKDGPVTEALRYGLPLLLRGIDEPDSAVLESLNAVLEAHRGKRSILINGKREDVCEGFYIVCTARPSMAQHNLTPALASRFLAVEFSGKVSEFGFRELFKCYQPEFLHTRPQMSKAAMDKVGTALMNDGRKTFNISDVARVMKAVRSVWDFWEEKMGMDRVVARLGPMARTLAAFVTDSEKNFNDEDWPVQFEQLKQPGREVDFTFTPSRRRAMNVIATCVKCRLPLILQGIAGIGKTKMVEITHELCRDEGDTRALEIIQFSSSTTLQDIIGFFLPCGDMKCDWVQGPLYRAMESGRILLCDEMNLAPSEVLSFLAPLLAMPKCFKCPVSNKTIILKQGFTLIAAQNPPTYPGRHELPKSLLTRMQKLEVPPYSEDEVIDILVKDACRRLTQDARERAEREEKQELRRRLHRLLQLIGYTGDGGSKGDSVTLRHVLKLLRRLVRPTFWNQFGVKSAARWEQVLLLHISIVFPRREDSELAAEITGCTFTLKKNGAEASVDLSDICNPLEVEVVQNLPVSARVALCKLAFCMYFKEPVLLTGPTCFKSFCASALGNRLKAVCLKPLNTVFLSNLTETCDLIGGIEPHSKESFLKYIRQCCNYLSKHADGVIFLSDQRGHLHRHRDFNSANCTQLQAFLEWYRDTGKRSGSKNVETNAEWCSKLIDQILQFGGSTVQGFPFCERGIMPSLRFGGMLLLKDFNLPDQAVTEGLNALTELQPSFRSGVTEQPLGLHNELFIVATKHEPESPGCSLSPAAMSRFSIVSVRPPKDLHGFRELLRSRLKDSDKLVNFVLGCVRALERCEGLGWRQDRLTIRHLLQWCDYLKIERAGSDVDKLVIGAQVLLLDQLSVAKRELAQNALAEIEKSVGANTRLHQDPDENDYGDDWITQADVLQYLGLQLCRGTRQRLSSFNDFVPSQASIRNLSRILLARDTGHPLCLVGPPGIGKSAIAEAAANLLGRAFTRISFSSSVTLEDLFGSYLPVPAETDSERKVFIFRPGQLSQAVEGEGVVLLDEVNLAPADVLGALCGMLSSGAEDEFCIKHCSLRRKRTIFICAMNPVSVGGGRQELPSSLRSLLTTIFLAPFIADEVKRIVQGRFEKNFSRTDIGGQPKLLDIALGLNERLSGAIEPLQYRNGVKFNLRTLQNLDAVLAAIPWEEYNDDQRKYLWITALMLIYARCWDPAAQASAERIIAKDVLKDGWEQWLIEWRQRRVPVSVLFGKLKLGPISNVGNSLVLFPKPTRAEKCDDFWSEAVTLPHRSAKQMRVIELLLLATQSGRLVLLEGPACSGKTTAVRDLAFLLNRRLLTVPMNADTEVSDLIGGFGVQQGCFCGQFGRDLCRAVNTILEGGQIDDVLQVQNLLGSGDVDIEQISFALLQFVEDDSDEFKFLAALPEKVRQTAESRGVRSLPFRFFEGPLMLALRCGYWVLLDNVNAARPEVVERINSLGEANSSIHLFELGAAANDPTLEAARGKVKPTEGFRLFATSTTKRGSAYTLSEAFRNRSIVLHCESLDAGLLSEDEEERQATFDMLCGMVQTCGCSGEVAQELVHLHESALAERRIVGKSARGQLVCGYELSVRNLLAAARMFGSGADIRIALKQSYDNMLGAVSSATCEVIDSLRTTNFTSQLVAAQGLPPRRAKAVSGDPETTLASMQAVRDVTVGMFLVEKFGKDGRSWLEKATVTKAMLDIVIASHNDRAAPLYVLKLVDGWLLDLPFLAQGLSVTDTVLTVKPVQNGREAKCTCNLNVCCLPLRLSVEMRSQANIWEMECSSPEASPSLFQLSRLVSANLQDLLKSTFLCKLGGSGKLKFHAKDSLAKFPLLVAGNPTVELDLKDSERWEFGLFCAGVSAGLHIRRLRTTLTTRKVRLHDFMAILELGPCELVLDFEESTCPSYNDPLGGQLLLRSSISKDVAMQEIGVIVSSRIANALPSITFKKLLYEVTISSLQHEKAVQVAWVLSLLQCEPWDLLLKLKLIDITTNVRGSFVQDPQPKLATKIRIDAALQSENSLLCRVQAELEDNIDSTSIAFCQQECKEFCEPWSKQQLCDALALPIDSPLLSNVRFEVVRDVVIQLPLGDENLRLLGNMGLDWLLFRPLLVILTRMSFDFKGQRGSFEVFGKLEVTGTVLDVEVTLEIDVEEARKNKFIAIHLPPVLKLERLLSEIVQLLFGCRDWVQTLAKVVQPENLTLHVREEIVLYYEGSVNASFTIRFDCWQPLQSFELSFPQAQMDVKRSNGSDWISSIHGGVLLFGLELPEMELILSPREDSEALKVLIKPGSLIVKEISVGAIVSALLKWDRASSLLKCPALETVLRFEVDLGTGMVEADFSLGDWQVFGEQVQMSKFKLTNGRTWFSRTEECSSATLDFVLVIGPPGQRIPFELPFHWSSAKDSLTADLKLTCLQDSMCVNGLVESILGLSLPAPNIVFSGRGALKGAALEVKLSDSGHGGPMATFKLECYGGHFEIKESPALQFLEKLLKIRECDMFIAYRDGKWDSNRNYIEGHLTMGHSEVKTPKFVMPLQGDGQWRIEIKRGEFPEHGRDGVELNTILPLGIMDKTFPIRVAFKEMELVAHGGGAGSSQFFSMELFGGKIDLTLLEEILPVSLEALRVKVKYDHTKTTWIERFQGTQVEGVLEVLGVKLRLDPSEFPPKTAVWRLQAKRTHGKEDNVKAGHLLSRLHVDSKAVLEMLQIDDEDQRLTTFEVNLMLKGDEFMQLRLAVGLGRGMIGTVLSTFGIKEVKIVVILKNVGDSRLEKEVWLASKLSLADVDIAIDLDVLKHEIRPQNLLKHIANEVLTAALTVLESAKGQIRDQFGGSDGDLQEVAHCVDRLDKNIRGLLKKSERDLDQADHLTWSRCSGDLDDLRSFAVAVKKASDGLRQKNLGEDVDNILIGLQDISSEIVSIVDKITPDTSVSNGLSAVVDFRLLTTQLKMEVTDGDNVQAQLLSRIKLDIADFRISIRKESVFIVATMMKETFEGGFQLVFTCRRDDGKWSWIFGAVHQNEVVFSQICKPLKFVDDIFHCMHITLLCPQLYLAQLQGKYPDKLVEELQYDLMKREGMGTHYLAIEDGDCVMKVYPKLTGVSKALEKYQESLQGSMKSIGSYTVLKQHQFADWCNCSTFMVFGLSIHLQNHWFWCLFGLGGKCFNAALLLTSTSDSNKEIDTRLVCPLIGKDQMLKLGPLTLVHCGLDLTTQFMRVEIHLKLQLPNGWNKDGGAGGKDFLLKGLVEMWQKPQGIKGGLLIEDWHEPFGLKRVTVHKGGVYLEMLEESPTTCNLSLESLISIEARNGRTLTAGLFVGFSKPPKPANLVIYVKRLDIITLLSLITGEELKGGVDWLRWIFPECKELLLMTISEGTFNLGEWSSMIKEASKTRASSQIYQAVGSKKCADHAVMTPDCPDLDDLLIKSVMPPGGIVEGPSIAVGASFSWLQDRVQLFTLLKIQPNDKKMEGTMKLNAQKIGGFIEMSHMDDSNKPLEVNFKLDWNVGNEQFCFKAAGKISIFQRLKIEMYLELTKSGFLVDFDFAFLGFNFHCFLMIRWECGFAVLMAIGEKAKVTEAFDANEIKTFEITNRPNGIRPADHGLEAFGEGVSGALKKLIEAAAEKLRAAQRKLDKAREGCRKLLRWTIDCAKFGVSIGQGALWILQKGITAIESMVEWIRSEVIRLDYFVVGGVFLEGDKQVLVRVRVRICRKELMLRFRVPLDSGSPGGAGTQKLYDLTAKRLTEKCGKDHSHELSEDCEHPTFQKIKRELESLQKGIGEAESDLNDRGENGQENPRHPPEGFEDMFSDEIDREECEKEEQKLPPPPEHKDPDEIIQEMKANEEKMREQNEQARWQDEAAKEHEASARRLSEESTKKAKEREREEELKQKREIMESQWHAREQEIREREERNRAWREHLDIAAEEQRSNDREERQRRERDERRRWDAIDSRNLQPVQKAPACRAEDAERHEESRGQMRQVHRQSSQHEENPIKNDPLHDKLHQICAEAIGSHPIAGYWDRVAQERKNSARELQRLELYRASLTELECLRKSEQIQLASQAKLYAFEREAREVLSEAEKRIVSVAKCLNREVAEVDGWIAQLRELVEEVIKQQYKARNIPAVAREPVRPSRDLAAVHPRLMTFEEQIAEAVRRSLQEAQAHNDRPPPPHEDNESQERDSSHDGAAEQIDDQEKKADQEKFRDDPDGCHGYIPNVGGEGEVEKLEQFEGGDEHVANREEADGPMGSTGEWYGASARYAEFAAQLQQRAAALAELLLHGRSQIAETDRSPVAHLMLVVDAATAAQDGVEGHLPQLVTLLLEAFERCNFSISLMLSGERELLTPFLAKHPNNLSSSGKEAAILHVLGYNAGLGGHIPEGPPPDLVISIAPSTIRSGARMFLGLSREAQQGLGSATLAGLLVGPRAEIQCWNWLASERRWNATTNVEAWLMSLLPPRHDQEIAEWHSRWLGWNEFGVCSAIEELDTIARAGKGAVAWGGISDTQAFGSGVLGAASQLPDEEDSEEDDALLPSDVFAEQRSKRLEMYADWQMDAAADLWDALANEADDMAEDVVSALSVVPPNAWTQFSTSAQGNRLSIPGLMNWYISQGTETAIWLNKNRGGRRRLGICFVLDLTPSHTLDSELVKSLFALLAAFERLHVQVVLVSFDSEGVLLVNEGKAWDLASKSRLIAVLARACDKKLQRSCRCNVVPAIVLGLQSLLSLSGSANSPKLLLLLTGGAVHSTANSLRRVCRLAERKQVAVFACSFSCRLLHSLGVPRWLSCSGKGLAHLVSCIFEADIPAQPPANGDLLKLIVQNEAFVLGVDRAWTTSGQQRAIRSPGKLGERHLYLTALLDYSTTDEEQKDNEARNVKIKPAMFVCAAKRVRFEIAPGDSRALRGIYCTGPDFRPIECDYPSGLEKATPPKDVAGSVVLTFKKSTIVTGFAITTGAGGYCKRWRVTLEPDHDPETHLPIETFRFDESKWRSNTTHTFRLDSDSDGYRGMPQLLLRSYYGRMLEHLQQLYEPRGSLGLAPEVVAQVLTAMWPPPDDLFAYNLNIGVMLFVKGEQLEQHVLHARQAFDKVRMQVQTGKGCPGGHELQEQDKVAICDACCSPQPNCMGCRVCEWDFCRVCLQDTEGGMKLQVIKSFCSLRDAQG